MYVDESGDPGLIGTPSRYFTLTGLVVHELEWQEVLDRTIAFRRSLKQRYGLNVTQEIHAASLIVRPGNLVNIPRYNRLAIIREYADFLASTPALNIINVVVDKQGKPPEYDVFEKAWQALLQRFENTLAYRNFLGAQNANDLGILFPDNTDGQKLRLLLRKMRKYNPIPSKYGTGSRNITVSKIIEDPNMRDSASSLFIQSTDLAAFLLYQRIAPNKYMKLKKGNNYFKRLMPILCTQASGDNKYGVVRL